MTDGGTGAFERESAMRRRGWAASGKGAAGIEHPAAGDGSSRAAEITFGAVTLRADLAVPKGAAGIVLFAHGSGSSRMSPRNRQVAGDLRAHGLGTLLFDLLTPEEERIDLRTSELRFDIPLLAERLVGATDWLLARDEAAKLPLGYFGASTGAAAALIAAARRPDVVAAVVSRSGRPDLAGRNLEEVRAPTLLIVGGLDYPVIEMNQTALGGLRVEKRLEIVEGATHLFEEPGTLERVAALATAWFLGHFRERTGRETPRADTGAAGRLESPRDSQNVQW